MIDEQFDELSGRIDGVARALMHLIADLEIREGLNGDRFCKKLRTVADQRSQHLGLSIQASTKVIREIADQLDDARAGRLSERRS